MKTLISTLVFFSAIQAAAAPDACHLLSKRDVAAVQGQPFAEARLTTTNDDGLPVSQCFYRLPSFSKSISLTLLRASHAAIEAYWEKRFGENRVADKREEPDREEAEERGARERTAVRGVGEEAFWTGNRLAGELTVRSRSAILRISVGGAGTVEQKIEKSKRLAKSALRRLE